MSLFKNSRGGRNCFLHQWFLHVGFSPIPPHTGRPSPSALADDAGLGGLSWSEKIRVRDGSLPELFGVERLEAADAHLPWQVRYRVPFQVDAQGFFVAVVACAAVRAIQAVVVQVSYLLANKVRVGDCRVAAVAYVLVDWESFDIHVNQPPLFWRPFPSLRQSPHRPGQRSGCPR
jgi:hypothetical protein